MSYPGLSTEFDMLLTKRFSYDANGSIEYAGAASPTGGAVSTADAAWRITKYEYDANSNVVAILLAEGNNNMEHVWDDRATLSFF